jgi:hypothetical protein
MKELIDENNYVLDWMEKALLDTTPDLVALTNFTQVMCGFTSG